MYGLGFEISRIKSATYPHFWFWRRHVELFDEMCPFVCDKALPCSQWVGSNSLLSFSLLNCVLVYPPCRLDTRVLCFRKECFFKCSLKWWLCIGRKKKMYKKWQSSSLGRCSQIWPWNIYKAQIFNHCCIFFTWLLTRIKSNNSGDFSYLILLTSGNSTPHPKHPFYLF